LPREVAIDIGSYEGRLLPGARGLREAYRGGASGRSTSRCRKRDQERVEVEAELKKRTAGCTAATRAVTAFLDSVERDMVEAGSRAGLGLRARLREREASAQALRVEAVGLQIRRDALRQKLLDAQVVAEGYRSLPRVLDAAREQGAHEEVRALLQAGVDVVEWREEAADPTRGTATIQFFELPDGFWETAQARKEEQLQRAPVRR
jgi:hypothetical protein